MAHDFTLRPGLKGFPLHAAAGPASRIAERGWNLLSADLPLPLATLQTEALAHNLAWMQAYAERKGVVLAPHAKTTLSPQLMAMQLAAGAWGLTVANPIQAALALQSGAQRVLIANQVLAPADLAGLRQLHQQHPSARLWFLVDSLAQVQQIEDWAEQQTTRADGAGEPGPFEVLLELGLTGQRTGVRSHAEACALAEAVRRARWLRLGGIECYEGGLAPCLQAAELATLHDLLQRAQALLAAAEHSDWFETDTVLLSAGGSAIFDLVLPLLRQRLRGRATQGVMRSGCYITHDHGHYRRLLAGVERREGLSDSLRPALTVWALVQSVPEAGLALLGCGRRDISFDIEMPMPQRHAARGSRQALPCPSDWRISALNDQHAYLRFGPNSGRAPAVGDRVELGISHPCTTFDKWRWLALVNENLDLVGAVETGF